MTNIVEKLTVNDLLYAAQTRCQCGAGLAYPLHSIDIHGSWICSAVLLDEVELDSGASQEYRHEHPSTFQGAVVDTKGQLHISLPFAFYEVKSESQPSAEGRTTRPCGTHVEHEPVCECKKCGCKWTAASRRPADRTKRNFDLDCPNTKCGALNEHPTRGYLTMDIEVRYPTIVVEGD